MYSEFDHLSGSHTENPFIERISPASVVVLEGEPLRLEFRIAVDSDGITWNEEGIRFIFQPTFGRFITDNPRRRRQSPPPIPQMPMFQVETPEYPQNYILDFSVISRYDAGVYTATATGMLLCSVICIFVDISFCSLIINRFFSRDCNSGGKKHYCSGDM